MRALAVGLLLVVLGVWAAGAYWLIGGRAMDWAREYAVGQLNAPASSDPAKVRVVIKEGETAASIAEKLERRGLIRSSLAFRWLSRTQGADSHFVPGEYELSASMTAGEIIAQLQQGGRQANLITIPEGWRTAEIADALAGRGLVERGVFLRMVEEGDFGYEFLRLRPAGVSLEGYLFPDSYRLTRRMGPQAIVEAMLRNFDRQVTPAMRQKGAAAGLTLHQVVTLASIVEREARLPEERPLIASVYLNRLRTGMLLQADPTVQYALVGPSPPTAPLEGYWQKELRPEDLNISSPYNTYKYPGLPPTPVSNPGLAAIQAVLEPAETDYLYFVAKEDGGHAFARTYEEHLANERQYRGESRPWLNPADQKGGVGGP